jgi:hypothetical protein
VSSQKPSILDGDGFGGPQQSREGLALVRGAAANTGAL